MITIVIYMLCIVYLLYYVNKHQEKKINENNEVPYDGATFMT